jgi:hypothetical protein
MCENDVNLNLEDTLNAIGFKQQEIPGLPEGVTAFVGSNAPQEPEPSNPWDGFEVISTYSRKQAIEDGVLVDLTSDGETKLLVQEAGILLPIAMTATAFHATVLAGTTENENGEFIFPGGQSTKGRLWDVLMVLRYSIRAANRRGDTDRVTFKVDVDTSGDGKHTTVNLWCMVGPGDDGEAVLTVMLDGED